MTIVRAQDRKFVSTDPEKCTGCLICEYVCSMTNEKTFNPIKSRIRVIRLGPLKNMAVTCRHCEDAPCVAACPKDALHQEEDGTITVNEQACNGCTWCVAACKFGAIMIHPEKKVVFICNSCKDQPDGPQCVEWCPEEALTFVTAQQLSQKSKISAVRNLFQKEKEATK